MAEVEEVEQPFRSCQMNLFVLIPTWSDAVDVRNSDDVFEIFCGNSDDFEIFVASLACPS